MFHSIHLIRQIEMERHDLHMGYGEIAVRHGLAESEVQRLLKLHDKYEPAARVLKVPDVAGWSFFEQNLEVRD